jgi:hypothetical protein
LGSLLALLGGGIGFAVGAGVGAVIGLIRDVHNSSVDTEFLTDVSSALTPGTFAIAAHVREDWVTPLDRRMEALGGRVLRGPMVADEERRARETAARRVELERLENEHANADEGSKPRLRRMIEDLRTRLERRREQDRLWRERISEQLRAKGRALKGRADHP